MDTSIGRAATWNRPSNLSGMRSNFDFDENIIKKVENLPKLKYVRDKIKSKSYTSRYDIINYLSEFTFDFITSMRKIFLILKNLIINLFLDRTEIVNSLSKINRSIILTRLFMKGAEERSLAGGTFMKRHVIAGLEVFEFDHKDSDQDRQRPSMIYYHGGGFIYCSPNHEYKYFLSKLSKLLKIKIFAINYKKAPETHFPNLTDFTYTTTLELLNNPDKFNFNLKSYILGGDSAGALILISNLYTMAVLGKNGGRKLLRENPPFMNFMISGAYNGLYAEVPSCHDQACIKRFPLKSVAYFSGIFLQGQEMLEKFHHGGFEYLYDYGMSGQFLVNRDIREHLNIENFNLKKYLPVEFRTGCFAIEKPYFKFSIDDKIIDVESLSKMSSIEDIDDVGFESSPLRTKTRKMTNMTNFEKNENIGHKLTLTAVKDPRSFPMNISNADLTTIFNCLPKSTINLFEISEFDCFRDDGVMMANRFIENGGRVVWRVHDRVKHCFPMCSYLLNKLWGSYDKAALIMLEDVWYGILDHQSRTS